jgi:hypothetical protein
LNELRWFDIPVHHCDAAFGVQLLMKERNMTIEAKDLGIFKYNHKKNYSRDGKLPIPWLHRGRI